MNKMEKRAYDMWMRNQNVDVSKMDNAELFLRAKQQDQLYLMAHRRLDRDFIKRLNKEREGIWDLI